MEKKYRLPKKFAEKWITALRSGEYNQAVFMLFDKNNNSFCCLGVACKMEYPLYYLKKNNVNSEYASVIIKGPKNLKYDLKKIPEELKGNIFDNKLVYKLTHLNDEDNFTFNQIADWIEKMFIFMNRFK